MRATPSSIWAWVRKKILRTNWPVIILSLLLVGAGIGMLYSAAGGSMDPWAKRQLARAGIGLGLMFFVSIINIRILMNLSLPIYIISIALLVVVDVMGHTGMGAQRWINLGFMHLQPSEPAKLAVILMVAFYFHRLNPEYIGRLTVVIPPLIIMAIPVLLILRQPNLGTATIICIITAALLFSAGIRWWKFITVGVTALIAAPFAWYSLHTYQQKRILTFLNPENDPLGAGYNILQSKIAIGSGGMTGKGFLQGSQSQLDFLPEKQTDFIFTMLAEEFGFAGGALLIFVFTVLLIYCYAIAFHSQNHFGRLVAFGVGTYFFVHIFINIGMVMGLLPVVGVPLPFMSYGGTSLLTSFIAVGLLLNVYVHRETVIPRITGMQ